MNPGKLTRDSLDNREGQPDSTHEDKCHFTWITTASEEALFGEAFYMNLGCRGVSEVPTSSVGRLLLSII